MLVCLIKIRLRIHAAQSLKEKRRVLKSVLEKTRHKFGLTIAEVGDNDLWQSSCIGAALVGNSRVLLEKEMEKVLAFIERDLGVEIIEVQHETWNFS